jgi:transcriptional regulator with XRE-family HTH domain
MARPSKFPSRERNPSQLDPRERKLVLLLKEERERQEISARALSKKVGFSRNTLTNLDRDEARPTLWVLLKVADGLGLDLAEVLRKASE